MGANVVFAFDGVLIMNSKRGGRAMSSDGTQDMALSRGVRDKIMPDYFLRYSYELNFQAHTIPSDQTTGRIFASKSWLSH